MGWGGQGTSLDSGNAEIGQLTVKQFEQAHLEIGLFVEEEIQRQCMLLSM